MKPTREKVLIVGENLRKRASQGRQGALLVCLGLNYRTGLGLAVVVSGQATSSPRVRHASLCVVPTVSLASGFMIWHFTSLGV